MTWLALVAKAGYVKCEAAVQIEEGTTFLAFDRDLARYEVNANRQTILRTTKEGTLSWRVGCEGMASGEFRQPNALAVAPDGRVYVVDVRNHRVQVFSRDGEFMFAFSHFGDGPGELNNPRGNLVYFDRTLYLCDSGNSRIQAFSSDGTPVGQLGLGHLSYPVALLVANDSRLVVADAQNASIKVFHLDGRPAYTFDCAGQLRYPCSLAQTEDGKLLVADSGRGRLVTCSMKGAVLKSTTLRTADGTSYIPRQLAWGGHILFVLAYPGNMFRLAAHASRHAVRI
jgi:sugar lactone lactonase YvrE